MVQTPEGVREPYEKVYAALGLKPKPPQAAT